MLTIQETLRAVFYVPFYAALAGQAFAAEGLDVTFVSSPTPSDAARRVMDGVVDVTWGGPMRLMQAYEQTPDCDLACFCEVVARDPFVLVGAVPNRGFQLRDLVRARLGTLAEVPTPWLCLQDDLRRAGIDPDGISRIGNRSMAENMAALREGLLDVVQIPEPLVGELLESGEGGVWYAASSRGPTSYTSLYARKPFLSSRPDEAAALVRALYRTQKWLHTASAVDIADLVAAFFEEVPRPRLAASIDRYRQAGIWGRTPRLEEEGYERLRAAIVSGGFASGVPYRVAVDNRFADRAIAADPPPLVPAGQ